VLKCGLGDHHAAMGEKEFQTSSVSEPPLKNSTFFKIQPIFLIKIQYFFKSKLNGRKSGINTRNSKSSKTKN